MKQAANLKYVPVTPPAAIVDNAAFVTGAVDTKGWRHLTFIVIFGAIDIAVASSKIRHSDASNMGSPADIAVGGTDYALATATDSDNLLHIFEVDLLGKKRYVDFEITGGDGAAGSYISVIAVLSRGEESPNSASEHGAVVYGTF
jgi:hypothetical protein